MLSKVEKELQATRYQVTYQQNGQNLRGKAAVIIGDEAGVGLATAVMLAEHGAPVFLAARNVTELKRALAAINQAGGESDGMVVDVSNADECRRFFMLAEGWLGRIDAVVNPLPGLELEDGQSSEVRSGDLKSAHAKSMASELALASQNLCMQEALLRMQAHGYGHIVNVNLAGYQRSGGSPEQRAAAHLRRQAGQQGIRVTVIEPRGGQTTHDLLTAQDIARCIIDSLSQPFSTDMVVLAGRPQEQVI